MPGHPVPAPEGPPRTNHLGCCHRRRRTPLKPRLLGRAGGPLPGKGLPSKTPAQPASRSPHRPQGTAQWQHSRCAW
eukprot:6525530-Lingulodinium_polyedra.AAC.1